MKKTSALLIGIVAFALGAAACGGFLGLSGDDDDDPPPPPTTPDAGADASASTNDEGGSSIDGAVPPGEDSGGAFVYGATCGGVRCAPNVPCCVPASGVPSLACQMNDGDCTSLMLLCTRNADCAPGQSCCVVRDTAASTTFSKCVPGACPSDKSDQLCVPADKSIDCSPRNCSAAAAAGSIYKLPDTLGICQ